MDKKTIILIPARMASTRFPGKPLAPIDGVPMVVYCARNALKTNLEVFVCTDSKEINSVCNLYDVNSIMTPECNTGTDRLAIACDQIDADYIINLQGDEPLIDEYSIKKIIDYIPLLSDSEDLIINGITSINSEEAFDPNNVKCAIIQEHEKVLYFSRKPLLNKAEQEQGNNYFKQIGLYALSVKNLKKFASLPQSNLEKAEKIEMLRWLEYGYSIKSCLLNCKNISVDTPHDLVEVIDRVTM